MKKLRYFAIGCFMSSIVFLQSLFGQETNNLKDYSGNNGYGPATIAWPTEGMVFQRNAANKGTGRLVAYVNYGYHAYRITYFLTKLDLKTGLPNGNPVQIGQIAPNFISTNLAKIDKDFGQLDAGWYEVGITLTYALGSRAGDYIGTKKVKFGIGDVFVIAGQSNARGFPAEWSPRIISYDPTITDKNGAYRSTDIPDAARTLSFHNVKIPNDGAFYYKSLIFPHFSTFGVIKREKLDDKTEQSKIFESPIYPMGFASWCWAPLAKYYIERVNGVPVQFYNVAIDNTSIAQWQKGTENYNRLRNLLRLQGSIQGVKGVLWHQGETDKLNGTTESDYQTKLQNLMDNMQEDIGLSNKLTWNISLVSWYQGGTSTSIRNAQANATSLKVFKRKGVDTDDILVGERDPHGGTHFHNNTHSKVAKKWMNNTNVPNILGDNLWDNTPSISYQGLIPLKVTQTSDSYIIEAEPEALVPNSANLYTYFWVENESDNLGTGFSSTSRKKTIPKSLVSDRTYWTCYLKRIDGNGEYYKVTAPFVLPNLKDKANSLTLPTGLAFAKNAESKSINVKSAGLNWTSTVSNPLWVSITQNPTGGWDDTEVIISTTENTTSSERTAVITFNGTDALGQTISKTLTINQAAAGGTTTQLSSLTPTSISMPNYGTLQTNQSVEGHSLRIGGQSFASGLGTHAYSNIKYNLGGQYTTFSGKVGLDDQVDNSCGGLHQVQFVVKADGSTLFTSPVVTPTMAAVPFSVNVSGKTQLELIVEPLANYYCDHADWVDVQLVSGGGGGCPIIASPTGVNANPGTINPGQSSTLSASCSQGSVVWSTGQTANSITVSPTASTTYTATCVSGTCSSGSVSVTVVVASAGSCSNLTDGLVVGTWQVTGQPLKVREFHGQKWLTQSAGTNPDVFVVRGSNMFLRSDVTLTNSSYASQMACFAWQNSGWDGLGTPNETTFPTPSGYNLTYSNGTPVYTASGTPPTCTNSYLTAAGASYSSSGDGVVRTNLNKNGTTLNINGTTYAKGLGTHSVSEIIYTVPSGQGFTTFTADVGRDQGAYGCVNCGAQDMVFKILNNTTGAVLAGPVTKGNYQSATALSANLSGVSSIKLIVEAGSDGLNWGDWANWANARFTCPNANARQINTETTETELFQILPNPNNGTFNVRIDAKMAGVVQFYLSNLNGIPLKNFEFNVEIGVSEHAVSVENLLPSTYLLKAIQGEKIEAKRLVIE